MSVYSREQINELKSTIDYFEFYKKYLPDLTQRGRLAWCCCPFHNEQKPSFSIDVTYGLARCWGACNEGYDIFSFYQKMFGVTFNEAVEQIAEMYEYTLEIDPEVQKQIDEKKKKYKANEVICRNFVDRLEKTPDALDYLINQRGFTEEIIDKFKLGVGINNLHKLVGPEKCEGLYNIGLLKKDDNGDYYSTFSSNRITIPRIDERGNILSFTGRLFVQPPEDKNPPKYLHTTNTLIYDKSQFVLGLYQAKKHIKALNSVICVEGELDLIKCHQKGIINTVSLSGLNISDEQVNLLKKYTNTFYVCVEDGAILKPNEKGETSLDKFYTKVKSNIPYAKVYIIDLRLPDGSKCDPDVYLNTHTKDDFKELIKNAKVYNEYIINSKLKGVNPRNIEEKTACLNMLTPLLTGIQNFMDRKQYIELVANKLMLPENDIYRKIKYYTEKQDKINSDNITWDSRPVYAQKILLSMCFCPNLDTKNVLYQINMQTLEHMEPFYRNIYENYIFKYVHSWLKEHSDIPVDFTEFFSDLNTNEEIHEVIRKTIMDIYFKIENLEDFTDEDIQELVLEQKESLLDYALPDYNTTNEYEGIDN